ncbi:Ig-like domain-containing protein [Flavobacterium sp. 1355]|uniref:Ig-like domain-containing protein n=1 Tax=Flavobacterium sp. 1355 TaxID=2806571 RepID=UPI001AE336E2|nr:Ig-like domain-containing protein [Flavobacterium sp. 1355]MBP1225683.1 gliding motility-associated-like protein [Flavobacterium sp. 1355]
MIKNYFTLKKIPNLKNTIYILVVFFVSIETSNAQCATPVAGCSNTDLSNFGSASNNNAATIEYDNFVSSWHSTVVRTSDGSFQVWGEYLANSGNTNLFSPVTLNAVNFPALTGTPLKVGLGSTSQFNVQGIVLATDGLYAWATEGIVLDNSLTSGSAFQKLTIGGNSTGLPTGVAPADVKMLFVTAKTVAITTCGGDVWVISQTASVRGNGAAGTSAATWYRVTTSDAGNPFLTDVVACRGSVDGLMALKSDGTIYVWGNNVLLGDNSAKIASQTTAIKMTLPSSVAPKMIGATGATNSKAYYVLMTDGNLYGVGENSTKELGDWSTTDRLGWVQPRYSNVATDVMADIKWFSSQEHDSQYGAVNVINNNKKLFAFGNSNNSLLGRGTGASDPGMPGGLTGSEDILAVETGGHTSMIVKSCESKFGYVGHRTNGSMGSGATNTVVESNYTFATANVQICGAESNPVIQPVSTGGGPDSKYCIDDPVLLNPTPTGGTLSIISGPGTLAGNTLSFTGVGTVVVQYSVVTTCGGTSVTTRNFDAALCPADLEVTKVVDNTTPSVGGNSVFTITAKNNGPYKATGVTINDVLPAGYTFVSATPSTGTWTDPNWTIGSLANGTSATLSITATVNATGAYANTAAISGNNPDGTTANNSSTATPVIQTNLSVTKSVDNTTPNVGDNITFTITASNAGPSAATGVKVTDVLPSGYTFVSATPSTGNWSAPEWTISNLANGASATLNVEVTVNATGNYTNTATISGEQNDPTPVNDSGSSTPAVNHAPIANDDDRTASPLDEDGADGTINILTNDTDPDGNPTAPVNGAGQFTVDLDPVTPGIQTSFFDAKGDWTLNTATGIVTFNPANNYNGTAKITYTLCDSYGLCDSADITFLVNAVNDNPVAVSDSYTVAEDTTLTLNPLTADSDADGDTLTVTSINGTALTGTTQEITVPNGKVAISATGVITFTPDANFNSATAINFPYVISDGNGGTATANQIITVTAVNDNPAAVSDSYTVAEDTTLTLNPLTGDSDVDGDTLTVTSINGTALTGTTQEITVPNGKVAISATGVITFTPDANFNSATAINFPYVISDGNGGTATANQIITVTAVNDNPAAVSDSYTVAEDTTLTLNPLTGDSDVDGDTLTVTSINGTALTGTTQEITVPNGKVTISATGVITFTPDANFNSAMAISFPYVISDGNGGTATANQLITVTAVNDNPIAVSDSYTVAEDTTITLNPLTADSDADGDTLTVSSINGTALTGVAQEITVPNGKVTISATGVITFTPDANFNSATAINFPYVISDGNGGTATANQIITVTAENDNPVAISDSYTVAEDTTITLNPLTGDSDTDGNTLTVTSINGVNLTGGVQEITVPNGKVTISATGVITFTPDANFNSATAISFPYVISDGQGGTATANQIITVTAENDNPVAISDSYTVAEDTTITLNPLTGDSDTDGNTLTVTSINGVNLTGGVQEITVPNGKVAISATGVITFTPDANFNSATAISFPYVISDGQGGTATANQIITVTAENDNPVAISDSYTVAEDTTITLNPLTGDSDTDGNTLTVTSINGVNLTGGVQEITVPNGKVAISATGVMTFTPDANFNSATAINFPYVISDGNGGTATANQIITVTAENDNPVAVSDSYTVAEDATITLNPLTGDSDADGDTLTVTSINGVNLTGGVQEITVPNGKVTISATGVITFTPDANFNSVTAISFPYVISDGQGGTATANQIITVTAENDNPVAVSDSYTVAEDVTITLNPLTADSDLDGDTLTVTSINGTALTGGAQEITVPNGKVTISATGVITFTPDANFNSATAISFPYVISDGQGGTATANQIITVTAENDNPVAISDSYTVAEDTTITLNPLTGDSDTDGDTLTITSINGTALTGVAQEITVPNGKVSISATGVMTFTPDTNFNSATAINFPYVISDGNGGTATANQIITVTAVNDNPVAVSDSYTVAEDTTLTLNPLTADSDADGDTLTVTSINGVNLTGGVQEITVPNGKVTISATGVITFTPDANFNSVTAISFPYVISDGQGGTATANQIITVTAVNDNPVAVSDSYTVAEDTTITLNPLTADSDVDGDTLTVTSINGTALTGKTQEITVPNGKVTISATGVITFTPDANFNSATAISFPYVISDGNGGTATANQIITVTAENDNPVAVSDSYTVAEDATITLNPLTGDSDADGDTLTVTSINGVNLTGGVQEITVPNGKVTISATGVMTFTPDANFNSATAISFPYVISDGNGGTATANQIITVTAENDNPVAVSDSYTVAEDTTLTLNPLTADSDADGDTLTVTSINGVNLIGGVQEITVPNGKVTISATGVMIFTPDANFNSATAISFPYVISDGNGGTATANEIITVTAENDAPIANDDTNAGVSSLAGATSINALSATDIDGTIAAYIVVSLPTNGVLSLAGTPITVNQILTPAEAATLTYDPSGTYTGLDTFIFTATDNLGAVSGSATITIPVVNNAPVAKDDTNVTIPSGAGATAINALTATDSDGTVVNYIVVTLPSNGVLALSGTPILVNQVLTPAEAALLTYDPNGVFSGNDTFTFTVTDNNGAVDSTPAVITIPIEKAALNAIKDEVASVVGINEVVDVINVLDNDTLNNNPVVLSDIKLVVLIPDPKGLLTLKPDGTAQIAPNTPAGTYALTYQICEAANSSNCTTTTTTVTVIAPEMTVTADSYCADNTAYVTYKVTADNFTPSGLVTINWIDSANNIVATQNNMPLNGTVLWPGAVVDSNNKPIDWPGWVLVNGQWTEGNDGFELTRPAVTMQFTLNPTKSVVVNYPSAAAGCNARPQFGIVAENDDDNIIADGINGSLQVINVLDNDKLNGVPVNPANVIVTGQNLPNGITLNEDGTIDVAPGTKGGNHTLTYQICEKANTNNCTTATVHIFVETPAVSLIMKASLNDNNGNGIPEAGETITYTFTVKNTGNTALENVLIKDLLPGVVINGGPINLGVGESDTFTFTGTYTLTQADINAGVVSNQATVSGLTHSGITATDTSDFENEGSDKPTLTNLNGCAIEIHNAVSLNGDQKNERFYIRGIECYPENTVQIYNRWGVLVFERDHYNNNDVVFKGFSEGRTTVKESNGLPEGTYYYIIRYKDNQSKPQEEAGYLYLTR